MSECDHNNDNTVNWSILNLFFLQLGSKVYKGMLIIDCSVSPEKSSYQERDLCDKISIFEEVTLTGVLLTPPL